MKKIFMESYMSLNELFAQYRKKPSAPTLTEVLKASQNLIYGIIVKVANHDHDSEDLTQEVLIKVIQNINILPKETNFGGWLNRTSLNAAINFYHQRQRIKTLDKQALEKSPNKESNEETIAIIYQHLSQLETNDESLILNKYIHQMTYAQMSSLYQLPKSTIESKINNILSKLKSSLEKAGFAGVAIGINSTLDQFKGNEISINLIPQLKKHFSANYPKPMHSRVAPKVFLKVALPIVAVLITFFTLNNLVFSNKQNNYPHTELVKSEKENPMKKNLKGDKEDPPFQFQKKQISEPIVVLKKPMEEIKATLPIIEEKETKIEKDFAGQLVDAESKKPIADAKLEIWDIYTHEKVESTTDAEGKYFIPKDLDTTFFFYLKFVKEDYAVKQTFQHFEIHKKISVFMSKGKKISQILTFDKPADTTIYRTAPIAFEKEQHLSMNQKHILKQIEALLIYKVPQEFFALQIIKLENVKDYSINVLVGNEERHGNLSCSGYEAWGGVDDFFSGEFRERRKATDIKLRFATTGKMACNTELEAFYYNGTAKSHHIITDQVGNIPEASRGIYFNSILKQGSIDYVVNHNAYFLNRYSENRLESSITNYLYPSTSILFEPLSLGGTYHNAQAIFGDNFFSKKSSVKKSKIFSGNLIVFDQFFERTLLTNCVQVPIGGIININDKLNSSNEKELKISIMVNNQKLKDETIEVSLKEDAQFTYSQPLKIGIHENGIGSINAPLQLKSILIKFTLKEITYSKVIDLDQVSGDMVLLNFNRPLAFQISQESIDSNLLAKAINKKAQKRNGMFKFDSVYDMKKIVNKNTFILFPDSVRTVFIEDGEEYFFVDYGFGIKTNYNQLKAANHLIKSNSDKIAVKPVSEADYSAFQLDIVDENGNEIKNIRWSMYEYDGDTNLITGRLSIPITTSEFSVSDEFCRNGDGNKISAEFLKEKTVGEQAILNKIVSLLNNRHYFLTVIADGYIWYREHIPTTEGKPINKRIVLRKSNSVKFNANHEFELYEIAKILKDGDIIVEYNGLPITSQEKFLKLLQECNLEKATIKLVRNNLPMSLIIPAFNIAGIEDYYFEDKNK